MVVDDRQVEIDFEQDSLRSRFIDIVSLLENGLEITDWDVSVDYPAFTGQLPFATWQQQRQRAEGNRCYTVGRVSPLLFLNYPVGVQLPITLRPCCHFVFCDQSQTHPFPFITVTANQALTPIRLQQPTHL